MFQIGALLLSVTAVLGVNVFDPIEPPLRFDLKGLEDETAPTARTSNVDTRFITMPLDHFDPLNSQTFQMRYMTNNEFFGGEGSPIFILVGGEWDIHSSWLRAGNMYDMAVENKGAMYYTEHRYYGETLPFQIFTTENLIYLNVDQALADLAYFIIDLKENPLFAKSPVILYGGSYAANMVIWFKQKYPHLVLGTIGSSGPIKAEVDFRGYLEVVDRVFRDEGSEQCVSILRNGINDTARNLQTEEGRLAIEMSYRLCSPLNINNEFDIAYFSGLITWSFSGIVQYLRPGDIQYLCSMIDSNTFGITDMDRIGGFVSWYRGLPPNSCWHLTYENYIGNYRVDRSNSLAWYYQTCTEYGYYQTAPTSGTVFDPLTYLNLDFYVDTCKTLFDPRFDTAFVKEAADHVNLKYGGLNPNVNNTVNIHGVHDPWRHLGVYDRHLAESSPTIDTPRASHCFDMRGWSATDTIRMTNARQDARRLVQKWLSEY